MNKPTIGIIGFGMVGRAIQYGFAQTADFRIYDIDPTISENTFKETIEESDFIFICVPTPADYKTGECDTSILEETIEKSREYMTPKKIIIIKSTIPPGTTKNIKERIPHLRIVFNPEFLTARTSRLDFINTSRIVLGGEAEDLCEIEGLYRLKFKNTPIYWTDSTTAEMVKYAANCFFASKVSLFNEYFGICRKLDIDFDEMMKMLMADGRIGNSHIDVPGHDGEFGFGGLCLVKGTNILTINGLKKIQDIKVGDILYDNIDKTEVTNVSSRVVNKTIKLNGRGRTLEGSEDHIHFIYKDGKLEEKLLKNTDIGDYIFIPKLDYPSSQTDIVIVGDAPNKYMKYWHRLIKNNKKIARMIGLYLSEGCCFEEKKGVFTTTWYIGQKDSYLADELIDTLKSIGLNPYKSEHNYEGTFGMSNTYKIRVRSRWLYEFLKIIKAGHNCYDKNISVEFIPESAKYIIGGWLDGDGNIYKGTIEGYSESKDLISSIDTMLLNLGINSSIAKDGHCIRISMKEDVKEVCSWTARLKFNEENYKRKISYKSPNMRKVSGGWIIPIKEIEVIEDKQKVYTIETSSHRYIANTMLTHNCFPKDLRGMIHRAKELGVDPKVLEAVWKKNLEVRKKRDWESIDGAVSNKA